MAMDPAGELARENLRLCKMKLPAVSRASRAFANSGLALRQKTMRVMSPCDSAAKTASAVTA
jgi:hypothetical protein